MNKRPLSPHLQIYRPQITSVLSIMHRITGVGLTFGLLLMAWGLWALAHGPSAYEGFRDCATSPLGKLVLIGFVLSLSYHMLNGVRHLFWDAGLGFKMEAVRASGWAVVIFSFLMTAFFACFYMFF
ncbi:MAG: succinate dehydrogenase, cytochrome b556 subunit [Pseudomonadota bacterium]|nr:succinate dehydrogenase, cytochrome b556 subunit [Pseudomonadota bacterium]QKK04794.1 MAG: succinate dehydrogenase, cytochrome b556 subunit [Pseudomonadota bacterium]